MISSPSRVANPAATSNPNDPISLVMAMTVMVASRKAIRHGICRRTAFAASAVLLVPVASIAIMNPIGQATAILCGIPDDRGLRVFDHELIAEDESIPKHLRRIPCQSRNGGRAGEHQRADDLQHVS